MMAYRHADTSRSLDRRAVIIKSASHAAVELSVTDTSQVGGIARGAVGVEHRPTSIAHVQFGPKDAIARSKARNPTLLMGAVDMTTGGGAAGRGYVR